MGNINTFLTEDDYKQIHSETGCKLRGKRHRYVCSLCVCVCYEELLCFSVSESQIRRLYSRFAHLDKRSKGYLM